MEEVVHPWLKLSFVVAQPPSNQHAAIVVCSDPAGGVQVVLKTRWSREPECPVNDLSFVTVPLLGKRSVIAEEDDAKLSGVGVIEPVVDALLCGLVVKDRFVGLHQVVAALEPVKLFGAGDRDRRPHNAGLRPRSRLPLSD